MCYLYTRILTFAVQQHAIFVFVRRVILDRNIRNMNFDGRREGRDNEKGNRVRYRKIEEHIEVASSRVRLCSRYIARRSSFFVGRGVSRIFLLSLFRGRWLRELRVPRFDKTQGLGRCRSLSSILNA